MSFVPAAVDAPTGPSEAQPAEMRPNASTKATPTQTSCKRVLLTQRCPFERSEILNRPLCFEERGAGQSTVGTDRLGRLACARQGDDLVRHLTRRRRRLPVCRAACAREGRARQAGLIRQQLDLRFEGCKSLGQLNVIHLLRYIDTPHTGSPIRYWSVEAELRLSPVRTVAGVSG